MPGVLWDLYKGQSGCRQRRKWYERSSEGPVGICRPLENLWLVLSDMGGDGIWPSYLVTGLRIDCKATKAEGGR